MTLSAFQYLPLLIIAAVISGCSDAPVRPTNPEVVISQPRTEAEIVYEKPIQVKTSPRVNLYPTEFNYLARWQQDNHAQAYQAFRRSCEYWRKLPRSRKMSGIFRLGTVGDWVYLCNKSVQQGAERQFFEREFKPYAISQGDSFKGLFTGYFVPQLRGSYTKTARYNVPIYRKPRDLVKQGKRSGRMRWGKLKQYYSRSEIYDGALANTGLELLWVDSALDAFFMEVQGSGRVLMTDGSLQGLGYAAKNGHAYFAIGKALVDNGEIAKKDISMQTIRAWINLHPQEGHALMRRNRSYVFFRRTTIKTGEGAVGAMNVPLTAHRSLAIDRKQFPLGVPLWLDAEHPTQPQHRLRQLMMAQDTGGAIKGAIRGDVYWGEGSEAGELAGVMKSAGRYFLLIPRNLKPS